MILVRRSKKLGHVVMTSVKHLCTGSTTYPCPTPSLPKPQPNMNFLSDPNNLDKIKENISSRKSGADIEEFQSLYKEIYLNTFIHDAKSSKDRETIEGRCLSSALSVPNMSAPGVLEMGDTNRLVHQTGDINKVPNFKIRTFDEIARILNGVRLANLTHTSGERSYYLIGPLAQLEQALINWTVDQLVAAGFSVVSVPDILHPDIISACGMNVEGERNQVYKLDNFYGSAALSGTAEMALGGMLAGSKHENLPLNMCAVSRCFRAETSAVQEEKGIYRVHQFTKVEMFCVSTDGESDSTLAKVLDLERSLFDQLGLTYRVLDMCGWELGDPASRKFDIEAWMPGRQGGFWGEISSCSNCTDYQSRRLGITTGEDGQFVHTVNGTACAVPRMILALCEQNQTEGGGVEVPKVLRPYLRGEEALIPKPKKKRPNFMYINSANYFSKSKSRD